jgi:hypothetical protein
MRGANFKRGVRSSAPGRVVTFSKI